MKNYATLLRLIVLNRFSILRPGSFKREDGRLDISKLVQGIAILIVLGMMLAFVIVVELMLYRGLAMLNHAELLPGMALLMSMLGTVLMSFFYVLASLYFSRDAVWMSYLPVSSRTVLTAKLTELWAGEAVINLGMLMPAFVMYGMHLRADALFYVRGVLIALMAPMMPLAIITLLSTLLARLVSRLNNSAALTSMLSMSIVLVVVGVEMTVIPRIPDDADAIWLMKLLLGREALLQTLTAAFPPVLWGVHALTGNLSELAMFAAASIGSMALVIVLLGKPYLGLCVRSTELGKPVKKVRITKDSYRSTSPLKALVTMELRDIFRSSVNLTQCVAGAVVFPLITGFMLMGSSISPEFAEMSGALQTMVKEVPTIGLVLIVSAILGFAGFVSPAACTAVSREGARHAMNRTLPVSAGLVLRAKLICSMLIDAVGIAAMLAVLAVGLRLPVQVIVSAVVFTAVFRYGMVSLMLLIDVIHPNLHWKTETQAVKQNINAMFGMLASLIGLALPVAAGVLLLIKDADLMLVFAAAAALVVLEAVLGGVLLHTVGKKRYAELEP